MIDLALKVLHHQRLKHYRFNELMTRFYKVLHYQSITYYRFSSKLMKVITIFKSIVQPKLLELLKLLNISDILCSIFVIKKALWKILKFTIKENK